MSIQLRDYFAAHCPKDFIKNPTWGEIKKFKGLDEDTRIEELKNEYYIEWECVSRYKYADAMLKAGML